MEEERRVHDYQIIDSGDKRILIFGGNRYETVYSRKLIELIIERKGLARTPEYFVHKEKREYLLLPLFNYLNSHGYKGLRLLEVGCSGGQFTELLNKQDCFSQIYSYDIDKLLVEVTKTKVDELGLNKVKQVDCFSSRETTDLPYENNFFDVIIVSSVLEHLPFENRYIYVDEYYRKLKTGGLIAFLDTPNRNYPLESHSVGLPFISKFSAQTAFIYAKLFGKLKGVDFPEFVRAGTGWRNASYYDCLPKTLFFVVKDVSEEMDYGYAFFKKIRRTMRSKIFILPFFSLVRFIALRLDFPVSFFLPYLNVVFKKTHDYEK